jgi:hypothetical protein
MNIKLKKTYIIEHENQHCLIVSMGRNLDNIYIVKIILHQNAHCQHLILIDVIPKDPLNLPKMNLLNKLTLKAF